MGNPTLFPLLSYFGQCTLSFAKCGSREMSHTGATPPYLAVRTRSIMQTMLMRSVRGRFATLPCVGHHSLILITRHPSRTLGDTPSCLLHTNCQCSERLLDAEEAGPAYILNCQPVVVALLPVSAPRDCHDHPPECAPQRERGARETWRGRLDQRAGGSTARQGRSLRQHAVRRERVWLCVHRKLHCARSLRWRRLATLRCSAVSVTGGRQHSEVQCRYTSSPTNITYTGVPPLL